MSKNNPLAVYVIDHPVFKINPTDKMAIELSTKIVASSEILTSNMVDEAIVLNLPKGIYYGLNQVGLRTWQLIQQPQLISDVYSILLDEYDAEPEQCKQELFEFLYDLYEQKLIQVH